jgi:hypothetical protein
MENLERLSVLRLKNFFYDVSMCAQQCENIRDQMANTSGEVKNAYAVIYNDNLHKLKMSIGKLWFYVTGCEELNPFEPGPV